MSDKNDYDFYDEIESRQNLVNDLARSKAPVFCQHCKEFIGKVVDNRFWAPPRYKGDRTVCGSVDTEPYCQIIDDTCPKCYKECPIFLREYEKMELDSDCLHCECLLYEMESQGSMIVYCEVHNCKHYDAHRKFDEKMEKEAESGACT